MPATHLQRLRQPDRLLAASVRAIPLSTAETDLYLDRNRTIRLFDHSVKLCDLITEPYTMCLSWQRVIDKRWEA